MSVPAGNLLTEKEDFEDAKYSHTYVASKAPWHQIVDDYPKYDAQPPGWPEPSVVRHVEAKDGEAAGSCLCGKVTFSVREKPARWLQCHCSRCRRGSSAAHASNMFYPSAQFSWQSGKDLVKLYKVPEAQRFTIGFCSSCGGGTPVEREGVPFVLVPAAILDGDIGMLPDAHIHVASKASWYEIRDTLRQFAELPPSLKEALRDNRIRRTRR